MTLKEEDVCIEATFKTKRRDISMTSCVDEYTLVFPF
jgi:hypothetical protein